MVPHVILVLIASISSVMLFNAMSKAVDENRPNASTLYMCLIVLIVVITVFIIIPKE